MGSPALRSAGWFGRPPPNHPEPDGRKLSRAHRVSLQRAAPPPSGEPSPPLNYSPAARSPECVWRVPDGWRQVADGGGGPVAPASMGNCPLTGGQEPRSPLPVRGRR